jgi:hypothetical protein
VWQGRGAWSGNGRLWPMKVKRAVSVEGEAGGVGIAEVDDGDGALGEFYLSFDLGAGVDEFGPAGPRDRALGFG